MKISLYSTLFIAALFFSLAVAGALSNVYPGNNYNECLYNIFLKTGDVRLAGTDARISLTLKESSASLFVVFVPNLESWGVMPSGHDYFERHNLDIFHAQAPCICTPVCYLELTSDGTGRNPGWYVDYLNVTILNTSTNKGGHTTFTINRWLAVDEPPYSLTAVIDQCKTTSLEALNGTNDEHRVMNKSFAAGGPDDDESAASKYD